jgi:hypothetical protein
VHPHVRSIFSVWWILGGLSCAATKDVSIRVAARPGASLGAFVPVGDFAVPALGVTGWELASYDIRSGFSFSVVGGRPPYSKLEIKTQTGPLASEAERLGSALAFGEAASDPQCGARWVRPLSEIRPGVWAFHVGTAGDRLCQLRGRSFVEVAYPERNRQTYMTCGADLFGLDVALAPAVLSACLDLPFHQGPGADALEELFHHELPMLGDLVFTPSIDGWRLASWNGNNGFTDAELRMEAIEGTSDAYVRRHLCMGKCDDDAARLSEITTRWRYFERDHGDPETALPQVGPDVWLKHYEERRMVMIFGAALSPSKAGFLTCDTTLKLDDTRSAQQLETFCRSVLERWRT